MCRPSVARTAVVAIACVAFLFHAPNATAQACFTPPSGLVGWWPGDGSGTNLAGSNQATFFSNATASAVGMVGQAFSFTGTTAYVSIPDSAALRPTNFTVECWVRFNSLNSTGGGNSPQGQQYIVFKQNTRSGNFEGIYLAKERRASGDIFVFGTSSSAGVEVEVDSVTPIVTNTWYHLAGVRGSNFIQLYVNGAFIGQTAVTFAQDYGTLPLFLGSSGQTYWDHKLAGTLDEVSLYNRPLSAAEISSIFNAGAAGKCKPTGAPAITAQPQSQSVPQGSNATFSVTATGNAPLSYDWRLGGVSLGAANSNVLALTNVQPTNAGNYTVVITNANGAITSSVAILTVVIPPAISPQPLGGTAVTGASVTFNSGATGTAPLVYRWRLNGTPLTNNARITGATTDTLTITNLQSNDAGNYTLLVTNTAGSATSDPAPLVVNAPPFITVPPSSQQVIVGTNVNFNVTATGTAPLSYIWLQNGSPLVDGGNVSGSSTAQLSLTDVQLSDSSTFQVIVTNVAGAVTSAVVSLDVILPPTLPSIITPPDPVVAIAGTNVSFTVSADGTAPLAYRWQKNGTNLNNVGNVSGATSAQLNLANIQGADAASYRVVVTNIAGAATSIVATLTVNVPPGITNQPQGQSVFVGATVSFGVGTTGTEPLTYQWLRDNVPLSDIDNVSGSTTSNLVLTNVQLTDTASFTVVVTNVAGSITSAPTALVVSLAPTLPSIVTPPDPVVAIAGTNVSFSVVADGTTPLSFRWQKNGTNLNDIGNVTGATSAQLNLSNVQPADSANYRVVVTNVAGAVTSIVASLTVNVPPSISGQPTNRTVVVGTNVSFTVTASGTAPLSYQWLRDGLPVSDTNNIAGSSTSNLTLTAVQTNDNSTFTVIITNVAGSITSAPAVLVVNPAPVAPGIDTPPASLAVTVGSNASFSVAASGTSPLSYQWRRNGTNLNNGGNISGATTSQLVITNAQTSNAANYQVVVTNIAGAVTSVVATLTVNVPPSITNQPQNRTVVAGTNVSFTVGATGTAPLSYQWLRNGSPVSDTTNITGSTTTNLTLTAVQTNDTSTFTVIVTNVAGSITSSVATLTVNAAPIAPSIVTPPSSLVVNVGTNISFSVVADGTSPLSYRWRRNGTNLNNGGNISGVTNSQLVITNVQTSNAANYQVVVTNSVGAITSVVATLTVNVPPSISGQPTNRTVVAGTNVSFTVTASGTAPLSYQWLRNGSPVSNTTNITGATTSNLTLTAVQTNDSSTFQVVITNVAGSITSSVATLTVNPAPVAPSITTPPSNLVVNVGTNASFSVVAGGTAPLSYQWRRNGTNITNGGNVSGATTSQLNITNVQASNAANYQVVVTNVAGAVTSVVASLTVNVPPSISAQPQSQSVAPGATALFGVTAAGTAPLTYQWRYNNSNLVDGGQFSGATTSLLTITNAQSNNSGNFTVFITNVAGSITSSAASLLVTTGPTCFAAPTGLVGWWPGDGTASDIAGTFTGSLQAGATASGSGLVGPAFTFNGTTASVSIPDNVALRPAQFTIECWVKFNSLDSTGSGGSPAGQQYIVFKQNSRSGNFEGIYLAKERRAVGDIFIFGTSSSAGVEANAETTTPIVTNQWYHLAGVRNANQLILYVNGTQAAQVAVGFAQDYGTLPLYFGSSGQSYWDHKLAGSLDEVSLYNRPLTVAEISAIFNAGAGGKCKVPVAPTIVSQPTNLTLVPGGTATFSVVASGTSPLAYKWFKDSFLLTNGGNISGASNSSLVISSTTVADIGNYQVVVSNSIGAATSVVASLSTGVAPANDNLASAQVITGVLGSATGNNANATKQSGEPDHAGVAGGRSVWYDWTAPSTSPVTFDTARSAFDTMLAVYTGNAVNGLTLVASNNDIASNNVHSRLTFTPVAGTVYHVAVDGAGIANGNIMLRWAQASAAVPDLSIFSTAVNPRITTETFASSSCAVMEGLIQAGTRRLIRFDTQTANSGNGDLFFGNPANNPLFVFAPCHAHYHFQNYMSYRLRNSSGQLVAVGLKVGFCVLDVFRWDPGAPNNALYNCNNQGIQAGWGDLYDSTLDGQWIDITGLPDGNYTMEMEANPQGIIQEKDYSNNLTTVPIAIGNPNAAPLNDNFASAQQLLGGFTSVPGVTGNATKQSGEPNHAGDAGGHSVWYQWTAISTKAVTIDTLSSSFDTTLAVYTGSTLNNLTVVASNNDIGPGTMQSRVTFNATAGTVYRIAVDGAGGASGNLVLTLNQTIGNDNFGNCQFIGGPTGLAYGANAGASKEAGEPNHAGNAGGQSIWYCWTAPVSGSVTFDTLGSQFDTLLAVYTGNSFGTLNVVASNDDIATGETHSRVTFNATGLQMYRIAIDGFDNASGDSTLNWNLVANAPGLVDRSQSGSYTLISQPGGPKLTSRFLPEGEFQIKIAGQPRQNYRIEISCDLVKWTPAVATLADDEGSAYFTDKTTMSTSLRSAIGDPVCGPQDVVGAPTPAKGRFYRAIAIPQMQ